MDITIPVTVARPGSTVHTPFGDTEAPGTSENATLTLHVDDTTKAILASVFSSTAGEKLTADALAALYSPAELTAALTKALSK